MPRVTTPIFLRSALSRLLVLRYGICWRAAPSPVAALLSHLTRQRRQPRLDLAQVLVERRVEYGEGATGDAAEVWEGCDAPWLVDGHDSFLGTHQVVARRHVLGDLDVHLAARACRERQPAINLPPAQPLQSQRTACKHCAEVAQLKVYCKISLQNIAVAKHRTAKHRTAKRCESGGLSGCRLGKESPRRRRYSCCRIDQRSVCFQVEEVLGEVRNSKSEVLQGACGAVVVHARPLISLPPHHIRNSDSTSPKIAKLIVVITTYPLPDSGSFCIAP